MAVLEIDSELFAQRLADLLVAKRRGIGGSRSALARRSAGRFSTGDLRRIEAGRTTLTPEIVDELTGLYDVDLAAILPERAPMAIAPGAISVGGMSTSFVGSDPTSLLKAYLQLVRSLRNQRKAPIIVLRRQDIESLAAYLDEQGEDVLDRLAALMGATRSQRTSMTALFSTGAAVIGIVGASAVAHRAVGNDHVTGSVRAKVVVAVNPPPSAASSSAFSTISAAPVVVIGSSGIAAAASPEAGQDESIPTTTASSIATDAIATPAAAPPSAAPTSTAAAATDHARSTTTKSHAGSSSNASASSVGSSGGDQTGDAPTTTVASDAPVTTLSPLLPVDAPLVDVGTPPVPTSTTPVYAVGEPPVPSIPDSDVDQTTTTPTTVQPDAGAPGDAGSQDVAATSTTLPG